VDDLGLLVRVNPRETELGFAVLHGVPPPVQADTGKVMMPVAEVVETVCAPEHALPNVAPEQV
jgi:hypothetical protein